MAGYFFAASKPGGVTIQYWMRWPSKEATQRSFTSPVAVSRTSSCPWRVICWAEPLAGSTR